MSTDRDTTGVGNGTGTVGSSCWRPLSSSSRRVPRKRGVGAFPSNSPSPSCFLSPALPPALATGGSHPVATVGEPGLRGRPVPDDRRRPVRSRGDGYLPARRVHGRKVLRRSPATYRPDSGVQRPRGKGPPSNNVPEPGGEAKIGSRVTVVVGAARQEHLLVQP